MLHKNDKRATGLQLSKNSTPELMKAYFSKVFELKQTGDEFPIDLDEVWPLVYSQKVRAVEVLKSDFIENEDYILLSQNVKQNRRGGHNRIDYKLSVACMEYFIAKKVKPVFEVYRRVFHSVVNNAILGIEPVGLVDGILFYPYQKLIEALGSSVRGGQYSKRWRRYPFEFEFVNDIRCVSRDLANVLHKNHTLLKERRVITNRNPKYIEQNFAQQLSLFDENKTVALLAKIAKIEDSNLRLSIVNELMGGLA